MKSFAILFAGGGSRSSYYRRYPNDLQLLLDTLVGFPGLDVSRVYVLCGPGGEAFTFDGSNLIASVAQLPELAAAMGAISKQAGPEDRLLMFASNHGGRDLSGRTASSYLHCWGPSRIYPAHLDMLCAAVACQFQVFVLGQCFAGGFVDPLKRANRAILTACTDTEYSYACASMSGNYDEFLFRVAEALHVKLYSIADVFDYARKADAAKETPQYYDGGIGAIPLW